MRQKLKTEDQVSLQVAENAPPVVYSEQRKPASKNGFEGLLAYSKSTEERYVLSKSGRTVKLAWPGVRVTASQMAELLKGLPRGRRIDGATRFGTRSATLSFDGKLRRGRLAPPAEPGIILVWTDPEHSFEKLEKGSQDLFEPQGECLGRLVLETSRQRAVARIYRNPEQKEPGFVLLRRGEIVQSNDWLETLDHPEEARLCQVVVEGDLPWESGIPSAFRGRFRKLARLAAQKSQELLQTLPDPKENRALIPELLESPKFTAAVEAHRGSLPPLPTIRQVLELLQGSGGRRQVPEIIEFLKIPVSRFEQILLEMDNVLRRGEEVCLSRSLDGEWLLLHQDVLIRIFALNPEARASDGLVVASSLEGGERSIDIPVVLEPKERRVIEALLRYGRLSERELSQVAGSRRVGGLLEKLVSRLESAGAYVLKVAGSSDDGRIYELTA